MSRFRPESLRLELGLHSVEFQSLDRRLAKWVVRATAPLEAGFAGRVARQQHADSLLATLTRLLQGNAPAGATLEGQISDECVRYFIVEPPTNAKSINDLRSAAALRFESLYGDAMSEWTIEADWCASRRFLACAAPAAWLVAVPAAAAACGLRYAGTSMEFVRDWNRYRRQLREPHAWVVHAGRRAVALAACDSGSIVAISSTGIRLPLMVEDLAAEIGRSVLRWDLPAPSTIYLVGTGLDGIQDRQLGAATLVKISSPMTVERLPVGGTV